MQEPIASAKTPSGRRRAKLAAGTLALTMVAFGAAVAISAAPAFANVTSNDYSIGSVAGAVTNIAVSPASVNSQAAAQSFDVTFTATAALTSADTITVTASPAFQSAASNVQLIDHSNTCFQNVGTPVTDAATGFQVIMATNCTVAVGDEVEVDFSAVASTTQTVDLSVATTNNGASSATADVTVNAEPPDVSASSDALGADASYTITSLGVTGALGGNWSTFSGTPDSAGFLALTATALTWYSSTGGAGYTVTYTPSGGTATADAVTAAVVSGGGADVLLTLTDSIPENSTVTITALGTNPTTAETGFIGITPEQSQGTPTPVITPVVPSPEVTSLTFGTSVTTPIVSVSPSLASATATYTVSFGASTGFTPITGTATSIIFNETKGATNFATVDGILVSDTTQGWHTVVNVPSATAVVTTGEAEMGLPTGDVVKGGDLLTVTLANVTNPGVQVISDFSITTAGDTVAADAAAYSIGVSSSAGVTVVASPSTTGSLSTYTISNIHASAAMVGGSLTSGEIALELPEGTVFPNSAGDIDVTDSTTTTGSGAASLLDAYVGSNSTVTETLNGTATPIVGPAVIFTVPNGINSGDILTITVEDAINPPTGSTSDTITLLGLVAGPAVTAPIFPDSNVNYPDGGIVNFAGTYYLFAGGHAFGIPSLKVLGALQVVDHATVLSVATGTTVPTTVPAVGGVVVVYNNPTIYVVGTDGQLHGFATTTQFLGDGYDPADVITLPNITGLTVGATAGSVGTGATAFATSANGAIVDSSGTDYVFAGGKAFGIPTPAKLTLVRATDPATPLAGTVTSSETGATIRSGTVVTLNSAVWVASGGSFFAFKTMKQLQADGYGGTPSIVIPNVGGITAVSVYTGS